MARILFTWELGEGSGHTTPYLDLIARLTTAGHEVGFALRSLHRANVQLRGLGARWYQAPYMLPRHAQVVLPVNSYARVLHNNGYDTADHLSGLVVAWRSLYQAVRPDLLVFDYSPTAMLAARDLGIPRVAVGTGFHLPPRSVPLPAFSGEPGDAGFEARLLETINRALDENGLTPLEQLTELFDVESTCLRTLPELDHYRHRPGAAYVGILRSPAGERPSWPDGTGPRVFAYLKAFSSLPALLEALERRRWPTLIHGDNLPPEVIARPSAPTLRFVPRPLDMSCIGREAAIGVCNAGHGSTAELLLAGVPLLLLPLYAEQELMAMNVERLGAGLAAPRRHPGPMARKLDRLHAEPAFRVAAEAFGRRCRQRSSGDMTGLLERRISALLGTG